MKLFTGLLVVVVFFILGFIVIGSSKRQTVDVPIFFYGNTCPHCKDVEEWMKENKVEEKIKIVKKEVYENRQNASELTKAALSCGLSTDSIGVPFLYAGGKCLIGTPDIINYFKLKTGAE